MLDGLAGRLRTWVPGLSLRARVGLLVGIAVGVAVAGSSLAAYVTVADQVHQRRDRTLIQRAHAAATGSLANPELLTQTPPDAFGAVDVRIGLITADPDDATPANRGIISAAGDKQPPYAPVERQVALGERDQAIFTGRAGGQEFRVVVVPTKDEGSALIIAQATSDLEDTLDRLGVVLLLVGAVGVALAFWAGHAIARAGLRPVEQLTLAAEHVAATQRLDPIEVRGSDELARLTAAFNAMLTALDASRHRQRALVADAGHELRTPLTSLRTNLDLLAQSDRQGGLADADRRDLLADVRAQVAELSQLVGDLVDLAREDPPVPASDAVDLSDVVARAVDRVTRRAPQVRFATDLTPWVVRGDAAVLERAVTNLLDNAAKWSPPDGLVTTTLHEGVLQVRDQGPGIAASDLPHVFDRFYRSREARSLPGSGLGLAIVRHAAERHGGSVEATSAPDGGAVLRLRLPGTAPLATPGAPAETLPPRAGDAADDASSQPLGRLSGSSQP